MNTEITQAHLMAERRPRPKKAAPAKALTLLPLTPAQMSYLLHFLLIVLGFALLVIGCIGHFFQPADETWKWMISGGIGTLFGKFSNRIGMPTLPPKPGRSDDEEKEDTP